MQHPQNERMFSDKQLIRLVGPLIIEQFLAVFIGLADTAMVSGISESAVSAVSLVDSINALLIMLFSAMAAGGAVITSQYLGRHDSDNAGNAAKQLLHVTFLFSLLISAVAICFGKPVLTMCFGTLADSTMNYCRTYFFWSALSYPMLAIYNGGAALLRATGDSRSSMQISLIMNLFNVAGNYFLIYILRMEVAGAAIASLCSRTLAAILAMRMLFTRCRTIRIHQPLKLQPDFPMIRRIFGIAIPNGIENSMFQIGKILMAGIMSTMGEAMVAANAVAGNLTTLVCIPGGAFGLAMVTVIGHTVGAGDEEQTRYYTKKMMVWDWSICAVCYIGLFFGARLLPSLFSLSLPALDMAEQLLQVYAITSLFLWPGAFTLPCALRAAGDARYTMIVSMCTMWLVRVATAYLFIYGFHLGLPGVWYAMELDWVVRFALFYHRVRGTKWLRRRVVD